MSDGIGSPERGPLRVHDVRLALSDYEWNAVEAHAREVGITIDALLSLVVAFGSRASTHTASCLAMVDICRPYSVQAARR